jgi:hypothetical protein
MRQARNNSRVWREAGKAYSEKTQEHVQVTQSQIEFSKFSRLPLSLRPIGDQIRDDSGEMSLQYISDFILE